MNVIAIMKNCAFLQNHLDRDALNKITDYSVLSCELLFNYNSFNWNGYFIEITNVSANIIDKWR